MILAAGQKIRSYLRGQRSTNPMAPFFEISVVAFPPKGLTSQYIQGFYPANEKSVIIETRWS